MKKLMLALVMMSPSIVMAGLERVKSESVYSAVKACVEAADRNCKFHFQVSRGVSRREVCRAGRSIHSCHLVDKAVDIFSSEACMDQVANCLRGSWSTLYCYKDWGIGGFLDYMEWGCSANSHRNHIHVQPAFGCKKAVRRLLKEHGIRCGRN